MTYHLEAIGYIKTCFPEKFGIPRQALLAHNAKAKLTLLAPYNNPDAIDGLEKSSHVWLNFIFHEHLGQAWNPKVRPPRLGGNKKCGVFATRSSFRPNGLGQSVVKLEGINVENNNVTLFFSGIDLLDGTPIVDIKPYIPYSDSVLNSYNHLAGDMPETCAVEFSNESELFCKESSNGDDLKNLLIDVLKQDPRPAYHDVDPNRVYKMKLLYFDIEWICKNRPDKKDKQISKEINKKIIEVLNITKA